MALRPGRGPAVPARRPQRGHLWRGPTWVGLVPFFMHVHTPGDHRPALGSRTSARPTCVPTPSTARDGLASGSACPWTPRASARSRWTRALQNCRTTGPRCGSADRSRRSRGPAIRRDRLLLPAPAAGTAHGDRPGSGPRRRALSARRAWGRDHFLTARWVLFSVLAGRPFFARAEHQPWPLHHAEALTADDSLITAAGLPAPAASPWCTTRRGSTSVSGGRGVRTRG